jgi:hypothetical protein
LSNLHAFNLLDLDLELDCEMWDWTTTTKTKTTRYLDSEVGRSPGVDNSETALVAASTSSLVLNKNSRETNSRILEISIFFQNVNRMRSKTGDLFEAVISSDFDVVVLLETSLSSSFHDEEIFDSRYFVFRCDRNPSSSHKQSGGGVLIAVKRIFDVEEIVTASGDSLEHVCVRLNCFKRSFSFRRCI